MLSRCTTSGVSPHVCDVVTYYTQIILGLFVVHCTCNFNVPYTTSCDLVLPQSLYGAVIIRSLAADYEEAVEL
jgi:hypothetical protein